MTKKIFLLTLFYSFIISYASGQSIDVLRQNIQEILVEKKATVGVALMGLNANDTLSINGDKRLPLQSVFKYHLALAVLNQVDQGKFNLNDRITITKDNLDNNLWSPMRKKYPEGADLSLNEILKYTVANSDNVGCDVLFKLVGGPEVVEGYMHQIGISDIAIKYNEANQQRVWKHQYENWTTAKAANTSLRVFFENSKQQLSSKSHNFLWQIMKASWNGEIAMKSFLPENTVIAHKTGHSGKNENGLTGAQNDIGIIFLPNGKYFYLSVLIGDSSEDSNVNKKIIADIAKLSWYYFVNK